MDEHTQDRVIIFDTTLRDGEQAPGCSMTLREKLRVASALRDLNVDVIEAGFAAASPGDFESVQAIAEEIKGPVICSLARCHPEDVARAAAAVKPAEKSRIHVFVATSEIHRNLKLQMAKEEIIRRAVESVQVAREHCDDVEFSAEDASRTEHAYLADVVQAVIEAGAGTINIPDTVGYTVPAEFAETFRYLKQNVKDINDVVLSVHCHDDLGMAVANSLAAVNAGARQVECTINGIGERAGNCSLEEMVMALKTRADFFKIGTNIDTTRLYPTSRLVSSITGMHVPRNKAIVGENAFAHEAGIHQHGMLKDASTYEIMKPEDVGLSRSNLVLGKHSGRHAFRERVAQLGFDLDDDELNRAFTEFKKLADRKKELFDGDLEAIIMNSGGTPAGPWTMDELQFSAGTGVSASATVRLSHTDGRMADETADGDGPVEAAFKALDCAAGFSMSLKNFEVRSVTVGEDAQGEVTVTVEYNDHNYRGHGISTDIVEAGALAYLEVINRISRRRNSGIDNSNSAAAKDAAVI
ncbi:MAG: 2-isopropylmalate synthase [Gammaproteobacteria bacterium]|nr:2-isopropylmalate synthase [Gammaproteobacteria bacterium]MCP4090550.1 2-isopropylmalate synthase [Gammaproteobacteria bacterium]MCP4276585.1 2-isopropylmalate synthase [Gammaproteobacteria bacterium]MCP4831349.1 2-isopropylmalate synthase [Gammaproteobacteria bacterium]MCP4928719.1 2-isopropylmalate synthase [Gammaproteobacteria bacterium]